MNCSFICEEWTLAKLKPSSRLENSDLKNSDPLVFRKLRPSILRPLECLENSDLKMSDPLGVMTNVENSDLKNSDPLGVSRT